MFTKSGDPTSDLTHAIQQVRDWHTWIHVNVDYARKLMPLIEYRLGFVFIGRRSHLTNASNRCQAYTVDRYVSMAYLD